MLAALTKGQQTLHYIHQGTCADFHAAAQCNRSSLRQEHGWYQQHQEVPEGTFPCIELLYYMLYKDQLVLTGEINNARPLINNAITPPTDAAMAATLLYL